MTVRNRANKVKCLVCGLVGESGTGFIRCVHGRWVGWICSPALRDCAERHLLDEHPQEVKVVAAAVAAPTVHERLHLVDDPPERVPPSHLSDEQYALAIETGVLDLTLPLEGDPDCKVCGGQGVTRQREACRCTEVDA